MDFKLFSSYASLRADQQRKKTSWSIFVEVILVSFSVSCLGETEWLSKRLKTLYLLYFPWNRSGHWAHDLICIRRDYFRLLQVVVGHGMREIPRDSNSSPFTFPLKQSRALRSLPHLYSSRLFLPPPASSRTGNEGGPKGFEHAIKYFSIRTLRTEVIFSHILVEVILALFSMWLVTRGGEAEEVIMGSKLFQVASLTSFEPIGAQK